MSAHPTDDELRPIIRELLRELLSTWPGPGDSPAGPHGPAAGPAGPATGPAAAAGPGSRAVLDAKAVLERHVNQAAEAGAQELVIGRHALLTPLARDRIRALGLTVRREA